MPLIGILRSGTVGELKDLSAVQGFRVIWIRGKPAQCIMYTTLIVISAHCMSIIARTVKKSNVYILVKC